jgi:hypothetical protein
LRVSLRTLPARDQEPHRDRRRVPVTGHEPLEHGVARGRGIEVKRLGVELGREGDHLAFIEGVCARLDPAR